MNIQIFKGGAKSKFLWTAAGSLLIVVSMLIGTEPVHGQIIDTSLPLWRCWNQSGRCCQAP